MNAALTKPDLEGSCYAPTRLQQIATHETEQLVIDAIEPCPARSPRLPAPQGLIPSLGVSSIRVLLVDGGLKCLGPTYVWGFPTVTAVFNCCSC